MSLDMDVWKRVVIGVSWAVCGATMGVAVVVEHVPAAWLYVPFAASVVVFGLPHGALDHLVVLRQRNQPLSLRSLARVAIEYLAIAAVALVVWLVVPGLAVLFFILLTWFHWGQGDLHALLHIQYVQHLRTRWQRGLAVFVRGGLPMFVPLLAFPDVYRDVAAALVAWFDPEAAVSFGWIAGDTFRATAGLAFCGVTVIALAWGWRQSPTPCRGWATDVWETVLLAGYFAVVHPVLAVGLYFCFWHATRHFARLIEADPDTRSLARDGQWFPLVLRLVQWAGPTTAAAIGLGGVIYLLAPSRPDVAFATLGLYLVLIAVLTVPHVWVVCRMDRVEQLWIGHS